MEADIAKGLAPGWGEPSNVTERVEVEIVLVKESKSTLKTFHENINFSALLKCCVQCAVNSL